MAGVVPASISLSSTVISKLKPKDNYHSSSLGISRIQSKYARSSALSAFPSFAFHRALPTYPSFAFHRALPTYPSFAFNRRIVKASVGSVEFILEPATNVKFQTALSVPGCSDSLVLLGTGYREKVFAIIGVKVYAAGLYINRSIIDKLNAWRGKPGVEIEKDSSLFRTIFEASSEKSLQIFLVRDVDGKTFWNAFDDAISPRIKKPTPDDESALSTFRNTFQGRPLNKGTFIFLTWLEPSKMLVSISFERLPSNVDATIDSSNVAAALFSVFFGDSPISPPLKASVANGLAALIK